MEICVVSWLIWARVRLARMTESLPWAPTRLDWRRRKRQGLSVRPNHSPARQDPKRLRGRRRR